MNFNFDNELEHKVTNMTVDSHCRFFTHSIHNDIIYHILYIIYYTLYYNQQQQGPKSSMSSSFHHRYRRSVHHLPSEREEESRTSQPPQLPVTSAGAGLPVPVSLPVPTLARPRIIVRVINIGQVLKTDRSSNTSAWKS